MAEKHAIHYTAAGGVVVHDDRVLVLRRPSASEVRLPKGHIDPGESPQEAALRETREESGYTGLAVQADLGTQVVEFDYAGRHVVRTEQYFLMALADNPDSPAGGEEQFEPAWLPWDEALAALTFEAEQEWVRRAQQVTKSPSHPVTKSPSHPVTKHDRALYRFALQLWRRPRL